MRAADIEFRYHSMPPQLLDDRAGELEDRMDLDVKYPRAPPEKALLDWLYLGVSKYSKIAGPPLDLELERLDKRRLQRLARSMSLSEEIKEWQSRKRKYDPDPDVSIGRELSWLPFSRKLIRREFIHARRDNSRMALSLFRTVACPDASAAPEVPGSLRMTNLYQDVAAARRSPTARHIARRDLLGLYREDHPNYKRIAELVQLSKADLSKLTGVPRSSIRFDGSIPAPVAEHLRELANIANLVADYFDGDVQKVGLWFELQNPMLGNISPRNMIRRGRHKRLLKFVLDAREAENAAPVPSSGAANVQEGSPGR